MTDPEEPGESSTSPKSGSIPLYLINGVATVWEAQTAATLHCLHGISGLRAGTLPGVAQQNGFLGLPVTLMQEETAYLVTQGIAHLIPLAPSITLASPEEIQNRTQQRITRLLKIEADNREKELERIKLGAQQFEKGGEKARLKREARAKAKAEKERAKALADGTDLFGGGEAAASASIPHTETSSAVTTDNTAGIGEDLTSTSQVELLVSEVSQSAISPIEATTQAITGNHFHSFPSHPLFPETTHLPPITTLPHPLFPFPSSPRDHALLRTFTSLTQTHHLRMGLGPRFGGEYLIYPGDYLRYHAHFTSQVLVRDQCIKPGELIAWGRLGTGTKKAGLLCCWDDGLVGDDIPVEQSGGEGEMRYYSLEWANFG